MYRSEHLLATAIAAILYPLLRAWISGRKVRRAKDADR